MDLADKNLQQKRLQQEEEKRQKVIKADQDRQDREFNK